MNHDATHCADFCADCPMHCYRADLEVDLRSKWKKFIGVPLSYSHFFGTDECIRDGERSEEQMNELLKAYELIKQYMDRLDIGIQTAWIYLEDAYRKAQKGEEE